jgi:hypothetical protein
MTLFVYNMLPALPCAINQLQVVSKEDTGKIVTTIIAYSVVLHLKFTISNNCPKINYSYVVLRSVS